ncbi:MAG TPA: hypothetical protein VNT42_11465 [Sphingomonas sp.]|nr:hypothetical protein [Sphingomonas sp.]
MATRTRPATWAGWHGTWEVLLRTKLSTCARKTRFATEADSVLAMRSSGLPLRPYRCDRCGRFHLTSRTKGKRLPAIPLE